jgi:hypothetical protein
MVNLQRASSSSGAALSSCRPKKLIARSQTGAEASNATLIGAPTG